MLQKIRVERLFIYPRVGHGFSYQQADAFAVHTNEFSRLIVRSSNLEVALRMGGSSIKYTYDISFMADNLDVLLIYTLPSMRMAPICNGHTPSAAYLQHLLALLRVKALLLDRTYCTQSVSFIPIEWIDPMIWK